MFRKEFVAVVTNTGMMTLKELKTYMDESNPEEITEFKLLQNPDFNDIKFATMCAEKYEMNYVDLTSIKIGKNIGTLAKKFLLRKYRVVPVQKTAKSTLVAIYDPTVKNDIQEIRAVFRGPVDFVFTHLSAWKKLYDGISESLDEILDSLEEVKQDEQISADIKEEDIGEEVIRMVNKILAEAYLRNASDIHIECYEKTTRIRFRVDGELTELDNPPNKKMILPIISRIKIMSQMDISEKRKPQDGRIKMKFAGNAIDYRVSTLPTLFGEKVVLRLLDQRALKLDMRDLGLDEKQLIILKEALFRPYGMVIVTGPTGSGKTTTLYSALSELNKIYSNISTIEDPVEYNLEGINQVNARPDIGLNFATALKAFLRQDPDIIMVGEIRDREVGEIAIEAALTGHMVLSTLHTNDAPSSITRLVQMGIESFLVTSALNAVIAQRLCRKICENCKELDTTINKDHLIAAGISPNSVERVKAYHGKGCSICNNSGYKGRVGIYEVLLLTPEIRDIILKGGHNEMIKKMAIQQGMKTLRMAALIKVAKGETTLQEAVTNSASDKI